MSIIQEIAYKFKCTKCFGVVVISSKSKTDFKPKCPNCYEQMLPLGDVK